MPRKQKQSQKQKQKQTVIVNIGESHSKRKRVRRRRQPSGGGAQQLQPTSLPPNVIYQSNQITPVPYQFNPEPAPKITEPAPKPKTLMEDVGVGTEGFVSILEKPTKKETLTELITPIPEKVPLSELNKQFLDKLDEKSKYFSSMKEPVTAPKITDKIEEPTVQLKGRDAGVPSFNFADFQPVEKPLKPTNDLPPLDTGIYTPYDNPIPTEPKKTAILSGMYQRYGPAIESSAKKREDARLKRNQQARERYAKKKEQQKPK